LYIVTLQQNKSTYLQRFPKLLFDQLTTNRHVTPGVENLLSPSMLVLHAIVFSGYRIVDWPVHLDWIRDCFIE